MNNKWTWLKEYMQKNNISQGEVADALQWQKTRVSELSLIHISEPTRR